MSRFAGRPLDRVWFTFLVMHLPTTLLVDLQVLYPASWVDGTPMQRLVQWYMDMTKDPVLSAGFTGGPEWDWFRSFICIEAFFQAPCFAIGAYMLWKNDRRVYPLLVAYGASTATTLVPVLQALFAADISTVELGMLLGSYVPFLVLPLGMAVDFGCRLVSIVSQADAAKKL